MSVQACSRTRVQPDACDGPATPAPGSEMDHGSLLRMPTAARLCAGNLSEGQADHACLSDFTFLDLPGFHAADRSRPDARAIPRADFHVCLPRIFAGRSYVLLLAEMKGQEQGRLDDDGATRSVRMARVCKALLAGFAGLSVFGAFCVLYLIKCLLGINIFDGPSPLHPLYVLFFR